MNIELLKQIITRLKRYSWFIATLAILFGTLFFWVASRSIKIYTSKATIFPLNNASVSDIGVSSSIVNVLGITDAPKSFTGDASINIVELAFSRNIRQEVAAANATLIPALKNKQIADLLIEENNKNSGFLKNSYIDTDGLDNDSKIDIASDILITHVNAKINKNGLFEFNYSNSNTNILKEISYIYIDKISKFYIDLKKKKAQIDYDFAVKKVDSLGIVRDELDRNLVKLDETTFFTNDQLKRFTTPKFNLETKKQTIQSQYYYAVNNREMAAYRLQKETPILQALDTPEPPYDFVKKSKKTYAIFGLFLGTLLGIVIVSWKIFFNFIKLELKKNNKPNVTE